MRVQVYIAGPITNSDPLKYMANLRRGIEVTTKLVKAGFAPVCTFANFTYFLLDPTIEREELLSCDRTLVRSSRAILVLDGWKNSDGTKSEINLALGEGIEVFYEAYDINEAIYVMKEFFEHELEQPEENW
jgi:hypothetical protein